MYQINGQSLIHNTKFVKIFEEELLLIFSKKTKKTYISLK